jgi:hypothetical protein
MGGRRGAADVFFFCFFERASLPVLHPVVMARAITVDLNSMIYEPAVMPI